MHNNNNHNHNDKTITAKKQSRMPLVIIIAIAVLTPLASTLMFFLWQPSASTHKGEVITATAKDGAPQLFPPPSWQRVMVAGDADDASEGWREQWRGKWILLQTTPTTTCAEECRRRLCLMRQLRLMLPGHYLRINRAWLIHNDDNDNINIKPLTAKSDCGEIEEKTAASQRAEPINLTEGIHLLKGNPDPLPIQEEELKRNDDNQLKREDYIYLIDPAGRLAMRFAPTLTIYDIRKDLSRLLKLSRGWRQTE